MSHIQVTVTFNAEETARSAALGLVDAQLAACAQVAGPIYSTFRWQGAVKQLTEWQCYVKTTVDRFPAIEDYIARTYPADTPEIIAMPIVRGSQAYLDWIEAEVHPA